MTKVKVNAKLLLIGCSLAVAFLGLVSGDKAEFSKNDHVEKRFSKAAVACDAPLCSEVASDILKKGGAIADAAIAGMLCMGVVHPQSSGIGGGLVAVYYNATSKTSRVINGRETAPSAAYESMFDNNEEKSNTGGLAIAVPGEIKGFLELYNLFGGKVPWKDLFTPAINLLNNGFPVDEHLAGAFRSAESYIMKDEAFSVFVDKNTGKPYVEGDIIKIPGFAQTLSHIANYGAETFYDPTSPLAQSIIRDLRRNESIITPRDLYSFNVTRQEAIKVALSGGLTVHTAGPPSSGASMVFILRILEKYRESLKQNDIKTSQILMEAYKHTYGRRNKCGDPDSPFYKKEVASFVKNMTESEEYLQKVLQKIDATNFNSTKTDANYYKDENSPVPKGSGTAHFAIVGPNGDSLSVTTTLGKYFGAKVRGISTGIIFNNKMNNFATSSKTRLNSPNKVRPGRRPVNTACPSIHTDSQGIVRLAIGGAGGMKIISAVSSSTVNHIWLGDSLVSAISARRLHHALSPMYIEYEPGFNLTVVKALESFGHKVMETKPVASVVGVARDENGTLYTTWDPRKPGSADGLNEDPAPITTTQSPETTRAAPSTTTTSTSTSTNPTTKTSTTAKTTAAPQTTTTTTSTSKTTEVPPTATESPATMGPKKSETSIKLEVNLNVQHN